MLLEKTLESPLDCKEIQPVHPKANQPKQAPILCPPDAKSDSSEKILKLGKIEGKRRRGQQKIRWLDVITDLMHMSSNNLWGIVEDREAWHAAVHRISKRDTT